MSGKAGRCPASGTAWVDGVVNVVVNPSDPAKPAIRLVLRNEAAWLLEPLPLDEEAVSAGSGSRTTGKDAPEGPTPVTPRLHAAAAEAPAARLASIAARTGERCMAGAARPTSASGVGTLAGPGDMAWTARSSNADSSRLGGPGVTALRREPSNRRSALTAARQPGQIATCWSQVRRVAAGRRRSAYALSIEPRCRGATNERARRTELTGSPELPVPTRSRGGSATARQSCSDRERDARGPHAAVSGLGECANGPCRA